MRRGHKLLSLAAFLLLAIYGVRAVSAWIGGPAYSRGRHLVDRGSYDQALPLLERGTLGLKASATLWLRGKVRVGLWLDGMALGQDPVDLEHYLLDAHREYTRAIAMSPASGWYWSSLGALYHQVERLERVREPVSLDLLGRSPWAWVGRPGRVAIGMTRMGIAREPAVYPFHDQLAVIFWDYELEEPALEAVREAARVQPVFRFHGFGTIEPVPEVLIDAFADASREALGRTPFLRRTLHMLALARLEYRRGNLDRAERDLLDSLEAPGEKLNRAEAHYYLGLVLTGKERYEEAVEAFRTAEELHPNFETVGVAGQARVAEAQGRTEEAMELLHRARRLEPRNLRYVLEFARLAREVGEWKKAEAALRWGITVDPGDSRLWRSLVVTFIRMERPQEARWALGQLERIEGASASVRSLRDTIERAESS
jgi:tetratricopeptide (TPR) repeat protein